MRVFGKQGGVGPWVVHLTCCGFDDGTWRQPTWEEADALRESYIAVVGHDRSAIVTFEPSGETTAPDPETGRNDG